jgi:hypothetical protein
LLIAAALLGLSLLSVGCGPVEPPRATVAPPPSAIADDGTLGLDAAVAAKLDVESRNLVALIEPGEFLEATIQTGAPAEIVAAARHGGGGGAVLDLGIAFVTADRDLVLGLLTRPDVQSAVLGEDLRATRPIAAARPAVAVPSSGMPYAGLPIPTDLSTVDIPPVPLAALLRTLGGTIVTIDGMPYASLIVGGFCQPESCDLSATGRVAKAGDVFDGWHVHTRQETGWVPFVGPGDRELGGIPRRLARAAEWIARSDPDTARRIATYSVIAESTWDPASPGTIVLRYRRECLGGSIGFGRELAATGVCVDHLVITVDLATDTIVNTVVEAGG